PNEEVRDGRFRSYSGILVPLYGMPHSGKSGTEQRDPSRVLAVSLWLRRHRSKSALAADRISRNKLRQGEARNARLR
ncbi:MAG: hypothetical protein AABZ02_06870, partial [Bacteroidota bacterium]